jgi:general secretion pathway protein G
MKTQQRHRRRSAGFTLMEIMLVMFIIALIIGSGVFMMKNVGEGAQISRAESDIKTWETILLRYRTTHLSLPSQQQGLEATVTRPDGVKKWMQLATPSALMDPWQHRYQYRNPGKKNVGRHDIFSLGPDGVEGTDDDIGNWE